MFSWIWEKSIFVIWPPLLTSNDLRSQKFEFWEVQNHLKVSNIRFELGRLKLILVFLTSIFTYLTSEVKGHDVYLFRIIMGGHTPIFVKIGRPWVKLCSSKVKGLLTYIVTLGHCDRPSYRGAPLLKNNTPQPVVYANLISKNLLLGSFNTAILPQNCLDPKFLNLVKLP